jgi:DNA replication licensing factor MCM2
MISQPSKVNSSGGTERPIQALSRTSLSGDIQIIEQSLLRKYILYAKTYVKPVLQEVDIHRVSIIFRILSYTVSLFFVKQIENLYKDLRAQSMETGGVPIAVRHLESLIRIAESSARMHLRDHVRQDDIDLSIKASYVCWTAV